MLFADTLASVATTKKGHDNSQKLSDAKRLF